MQRSNHVAFQRMLNEVASKQDIKLSPTAAEMLYNMVDAVTRDPHPSWRSDDKLKTSEAFDAFQRDMIDKLAPELSTIPYDKKERMTTFDLLHKVSPILDKICPFKKIPS